MLLPSNFKTTTALDNLSVRYANDQTKYAALRVMPAFLVPRSQGKFYVYDKQDLRAETLDAPSGTESHRFDYQVSSKSFNCKEFAAKHLVLGKDARDFDRPVADLRQDAALSNMDKMLIHMEVAFATKAGTTSLYPTGLTSALSNAWDTNVGDPIEDVRAAREAVFGSCGKRANAMCINQQCLDALKNHAAIVDRIKYIGMLDAAAVTKAIANLFELDEIVVSDVLKLTSAEGATDTTSSIWTTNVLIYVKSDATALRTMGYGRTMMVNNLTTKTIDRPELARGNLGAEEIETSWEWAQEFLAQDSTGDATAGYLYTGAYT